MSHPAEVTNRVARAFAVDRNFDAAVVSYVEALVAWRRGLGGFNKVVSSGARQRIMKSVLRLHFSNATENPDDGATFERLLALANASECPEFCGPRVLRTVIGLAQRTGHLQVTRGWFDRRLKILRPTEKWIAQEAERHEAALTSLSQLTQAGPRFLTAARGEALVARLATAAPPERAVGVALGAPDGSLRAVAALDGGLATVFAVADACLRGKRIPSHKEIGGHFRLSPSQARKILRMAADSGLVAFDAHGKIADCAALIGEIRRLISHEFTLYAKLAGPIRQREAELPLPVPVRDAGGGKHAPKHAQ